MLISLKMRRWRKHEDRTITFSDGLNAVRGANENGKTSMLMAIIYALWGVKALPLPLAEMVTWGFPEKEASVELVMSSGGEMYSFKRSSAGAECNHAGGVVTGQDEVTKFATGLLGVDSKMAQSLMFASQKAMSGALEAGPTAVNEYIEGLAGMDLFDTLMEKIAEHWTTGPTAKLDGTVAELEGKIEAGGPVEPDYTEWNDPIAKATAQLSDSTAMLPDAEVQVSQHGNAYNEAKAKADLRESAVRNLTAAEQTLTRKRGLLGADELLVKIPVDSARIAELEGFIRDEQALEATRRAYTAFSKLSTPEDTWEGTEASLKADIEAVSKAANAASKLGDRLIGDARVLESQIVTSSVCGFCQQDMSQFPEVAKKNAALTEQIALKRDEARTAVAEEVEKLGDLGTMRAVLASADPFNAFLRQYGQYVEANMESVPPILTWKGEPPSQAADNSGIKAELAHLVAARSKVDGAKARLPGLEQDVADAEELVARSKRDMPPEVSLDELYRAKLGADTYLADLQKSTMTQRTAIHNLEAAKAARLAQFEVEKRAFAQLAVTLSTVKADRDELVATNNLVKKIKAARPTIAAELWSVVLSSASVMFTNMRGEQSAITKSAKDFLVNGKTYKGLSGSATDLMGYAIRVALLKTFIPDCSFMVMDEASAACDENRTNALFGFIASAGFPQTLLVTHDPAAESVADSVIMI